jgi:hypothetical protein
VRRAPRRRVLEAAAFIGSLWAHQASAQQQGQWAVGFGAGVVSSGPLDLARGPLAGSTIRGLDGISLSLSADRLLTRDGPWRVRAGGELEYASLRSRHAVSAGGDPLSVGLDRVQTFGTMSVGRELGPALLYAGIGAGLSYDRLDLQARQALVQSQRLVPIGKVFGGVEWQTRGASFGLSAGVSDSVGRKF